jgi:hypothetical protein
MTSTVSFDSVCTCKICNHRFAKNCIAPGCDCCMGTSHSMIMDGIEGFAPDKMTRTEVD